MRKMKKILCISLLAFCFHNLSAQTSADNTFQKLGWLEGTWTRTNVKPGRSGHERWVKVSETEMQGWGVSMKGSDTSFVEKIKLIAEDGNIYYVADVPENKEPVYFKLIQVLDNGFVCENPQHDFPKRIEYRLDGLQLKATISGNGRSIEYLFERR
jgi:hypothetical protein